MDDVARTVGRIGVWMAWHTRWAGSAYGWRGTHGGPDRRMDDVARTVGRIGVWMTWHARWAGSVCGWRGTHGVGRIIDPPW